jgi:hypothetical protein
LRNGANRRESDGSLATVGDGWRRAIAIPPSPRAAFVASLAEHLKTLAIGGDIEAARIASDAIARLLGSSARVASVVDLETARRRRTD